MLKKIILMRGKKVNSCFSHKTHGRHSEKRLVVVKIAWIWKGAIRKHLTKKKAVAIKARFSVLKSFAKKIEYGNLKGSENWCWSQTHRIFWAIGVNGLFWGNILNLYFPGGEILKNEYEFTLNLVQISSIWISNMLLISSEFSISYDHDGIL